MVSTAESLVAPARGAGRYLEEDPEAGIFRVHRSAYRDQATFDAERARVWGRCWLYLGHESEVPEPGDFLLRTIGGRELIFLRDAGGARPRPSSTPAPTAARRSAGSRPATPGGSAASTTRGRSTPRGAWSPCRGPRPTRAGPSSGTGWASGRRARLEVEAGFVFISFHAGAPPLADYLGEAAYYLGLVADHSAAGMRVLPGAQHYASRANWKLGVENAMDGYHFAPSHITFLEYLHRTGFTTSDAGGRGRVLGNGHVVGIQNGHSGRVGFDWEPRFGEAHRRRIEDNRQALFGRLDGERATLIADYSRTVFVFPNLLLFDIEGISIRLLEPVAPDLTRISAFALAPADETAESRALRLKTLVSFIGPGGLATPDDLEAQEAVQRAVVATAGDTREGVDWNDVSRGMAADAAGEPIRTVDEGRVRAFWRHWASMVEETGGP